MKASLLKGLFLACGALALVACATPPERKAPTETDKQYIGAVDRAAGRVGARIIWINPPRKARVSEEENG